MFLSRCKANTHSSHSHDATAQHMLYMGFLVEPDLLYNIWYCYTLHNKSCKIHNGTIKGKCVYHRRHENTAYMCVCVCVCVYVCVCAHSDVLWFNPWERRWQNKDSLNTAHKHQADVQDLERALASYALIKYDIRSAAPRLLKHWSVLNKSAAVCPQCLLQVL